MPSKPAHADNATTPATVSATSAASTHLDVETDPTAFALAGNSLHVGLGRGNWRVDLGNFGLKLPSFAVGNDNFNVRFDGFGSKLQYFVRPSQRGWFVGLEGAVTRVAITHQASDVTSLRTQVGVGVQAGFRIMLTDHLYATPWLGVGYQLGARDAVIDGARYANPTISVFPAVHVGYQWQ